jgi:hypothetical protein
MFSAADEEQWRIITRHIDESDYYVVLVAHRYGSMTPEGISYTQKEYEYARDAGIPCFGFIIEEAAKWPADRMERDNQATVALAEFKGRIRDKPVGSWTNAEDLHGKVSIALMKAFNTQPREGWVRAGNAPGPEVTAELIRLSAESASLRRQLEAAAEAVTGGHRREIRQALETLTATERTLPYKYEGDEAWQETNVLLLDIFRQVAPSVITESSTAAISRDLAMAFHEDSDRDDWWIVATNHVTSIMADFVILDLIEPSKRRHPVSDDEEYWSLTPFGLDVLKELRKRILGSSLAEPPQETDEKSVDAQNGDHANVSPAAGERARTRVQSLDADTG